MKTLLVRHPVRLLLLVSWIALLIALPNTAELLNGYGGFSALGITGAIFANATGAGGGVVFVPFFNHLGFSAITIVATSFAIQCCGMTAGAVTWFRFYRQHHRHDGDWGQMGRVLAFSVPSSILGIWTVQIVEYQQWFSLHGDGVEALHLWFGIFSILLAIAIYGSIPLLKRTEFNQLLERTDLLALGLIGYCGGAITAWLSVGVGELVAVYLIMRGFNVTFAIACAVILSAFSVWGAIGYHGFITDAIYWPVVLFAGAGAVIGGIIAKRVVLLFSPTHLKVFFASWVLLLGMSGLPSIA
ncbi:sulfite exporter TauE/SafE family protein [Alteromonas sp. ASW11-36]|uniref:Probable membrane transporter protein n=1 Tax=Alteromonas arenosi TaxID=3055817 RepID=A0ABT7SVQ2_9ALTE|nr:sulfite exporter TauE/SafE family protein [Alteromonas sp. ASW11-36]MDM7860278.1 sulfite exporter TauE/SafE family protein [Alteromonas sp. ASW11-36]